MLRQCSSIHRTTFDAFLSFWIDWQITFLMLITMFLQSFLVVAGFFWKHTASRLLHASLWVAYLTIDVAGAYALGLMLASGCGNIFALYAPLVLYHLGATDCVNAYSPADNDLWHRTGFKMVLEIMAAAYIVSKSNDCPYYTATGVVLFVVGAFKYGEKIWALRNGSQAQILVSSRPIYKWMSVCHPNDPGRMSPLASTSSDRVINSRRPDFSGILLVSGEQEWYERYAKYPFQTTTKGIAAAVSWRDVRDCHELHSISFLEDVCLAFALFKIFRRRLTNLRIHQQDKDYDKVRGLLLLLGQDKIRIVIDLELSFIFDGIFSKAASGSLYQGIGFMSRLTSAILLFIAAMNLVAVDARHQMCTEDNAIHIPILLANFLVMSAIAIECMQIAKLVRSNWMRVWLACNYVRKARRVAKMGAGDSSTMHLTHEQAFGYETNNAHAGDLNALSRKQWRGLNNVFCDLILRAFSFVGKPKPTHWHFRLEQDSILVSTLDAICWEYFLHRTLDVAAMCRLWKFQARIWKLCGNLTTEKLQEHLMSKMLEMFKKREDVCDLRVDIANSLEKLKQPSVADTGLEKTVLTLHLLTSILEMRLMMSVKDVNLKENKQICCGLSRYCMHLMIHRSKLIPEDPDVAKVLYESLKHELKCLFFKQLGGLDDFKRKEILYPDRDLEASDVEFDMMYSALMDESPMKEMDIRVARSCELDSEEVWGILLDLWGKIVIYIVLTSENAHPHTEQMTKGGELLTHLWVLQGHLGGQQYLVRSWGT